MLKLIYTLLTTLVLQLALKTATIPSAVAQSQAMEKLIITFYDANESQSIANIRNLDSSQLHHLLSAPKESITWTGSSNSNPSIQARLTSDTLSKVLTDLGSNVKFEYSIIPAVSAHVPIEIADRLRHLQNQGLGIANVEADQEAHIVDDN